MVSGRGSMALAGPHLVRAAIGEDVTQEELGGARVHCRKSGVGDLEVADDEECIARIKQYLSFFPSNCEQPPPRREVTDPVDRREDALLDVLPESNRKPYDMYDVIRLIVDDGEWLDLKPKWARTVITCLARMGGRPVGIVGSQPRHLGGILDNDSADKAARFVNLCDAFGIPLVFLVDVPGFMVGTKVEAAGIIRHGAKMLHAVASATVPKITVVLRKAYGAGYYVMNGRAYEPDLIVAWPSAEISVMGAEGAVEIVFRKQVEAAEDPAAEKAKLIDAYRGLIDVYVAAGNGMIDDVIDPRETRPTIIKALCRRRRQENRASVEAAWRSSRVIGYGGLARGFRRAPGASQWTLPNDMSWTLCPSRSKCGRRPAIPCPCATPTTRRSARPCPTTPPGDRPSFPPASRRSRPSTSSTTASVVARVGHAARRGLDPRRLLGLHGRRSSTSAR